MPLPRLAQRAVILDSQCQVLVDLGGRARLGLEFELMLGAGQVTLDRRIEGQLARKSHVTVGGRDGAIEGPRPAARVVEVSFELPLTAMGRSVRINGDFEGFLCGKRLTEEGAQNTNEYGDQVAAHRVQLSG